ncbi:MAG: hypothetical protein ABJA02_12915 [Acidobacteriota bacterium]
MSNQISDEKFDSLVKVLFAEAAISDDKVNEIADSPAIWRNVQREIVTQRQATNSAWPPIAKFWQVLKFGLPALAAVGLLIGIIVFRPQTERTETAGVQQNSSTQPAELPAAMYAEPATPVISTLRSENATFTPRAEKRRLADHPATARRKPSVAAIKTTAKTPEIKTEFIALSYARDAESGQIVRVKVPSSMMVTLGLVATVEQPTNLVDAEVIVGDDGLTRAIRFIR